MIAGLLLWLVSALATAVAALGATRALRTGLVRLDLLQWLFWWLFLLMGTVLALGAVGILAPLPLAAAGLIMATAVISAAPRSVSEGLGLLRSAGLRLRGFARSRPFVLGLLLSAAGLALLRCAFYVWYLPPQVYDVLTYHLPKVADWIQEQRLVALPTPVARSFWPAGFELLQAWFAVFLRHDALIEAAGLPFCALAGGSVYSIARSFALPGRYAALAACSYVLTPVVLQNAVSCKNDLPVAALFLFSVALLLEWRRQPRAAIAIPSAVFAALALAAGIKPYLLFLLPALLVWSLWRERPTFARLRSAWSSFPSPLAVVALCVCAIGLGSYFYLRNAFVFGNPLHPTDFRLFGRLIFGDGHGMGQQGTFSLSSVSASLSALLTNRIFDGKAFSPDVGDMTGWGYLCFSVGIPGALAAAATDRRFAALAAMFAAAFCSLLAGVAPDAWNMRFMPWVPALFCVGFAMTAHAVRSVDIRRALIGLAVACLALNVVGSINNGWFKLANWRNALGYPAWERVTPTGYGPVWTRIPPGETLAYRLDDNDPVYALYGPAFRHKVRYLELGAGAPDFAAGMRRLGARYLFFKTDQHGQLRDVLDREVSAGHLRSLDGGLYQLDEAWRP
jgi:hypothetical protein